MRACLLLFMCGILFSSSTYAEKIRCKVLPTYFSYQSEELDAIADRHSERKMSLAELKKWDEIVRELNHSCNLGSTRHRLRAYLYTAQADAAFLSANIHGEAVGSFDPISYEVVKLFCDQVTEPEKSDEYSTALAKVVMIRIKERYQKEQDGLRDYPVGRDDPRVRELGKPYKGIMTASWKPWILNDPTTFLLPAPPARDDAFWKSQAELLKENQGEITDEEKGRVKYWEGKTEPESGNWDFIASVYMNKRGTPLMKRLLVRAMQAQAGIDTDIAIYFNKYTYMIIRPWVNNPQIQTLADRTPHPSFPSGHSTVSAMNAVLLTYFFPEEEEEWFELAKEAALSRVWGGVHYPIDTAEGRKLGLRLGKEIVFALRNRCL